MAARGQLVEVRRTEKKCGGYDHPRIDSQDEKTVVVVVRLIAPLAGSGWRRPDADESRKRRLAPAKVFVVRTVSYFDNPEVDIAVARRSKERLFFLGVRATVQNAVHACAFESGLARAIVGSLQ